MISERECFKPFIITQIRELQNEFLLADDELLKNKQDFSDILYKYIDRRIPKTCLRIFEYRNRICLAYYILTDLTEP
ncbi:MAG: hypothetical protein LUC97_08185 [Clostridiales bacterium]|nr:hypothetical protein [Clostridiales bacterium]